MPTKEEIEAAARAMCVEAGENPDAIGYPPNDLGAATPDSAAPRWFRWKRFASIGLEAAERTRAPIAMGFW